MVSMELEADWIVEYSPKAKKQLKLLEKEHPKVYAAAAVLTKEIALTGPIRNNWTHFSSLQKNSRIPEGSYHCHIKGGRPTFVACWRVESKKIKIVEIFYVGTHEKAPY